MTKPIDPFDVALGARIRVRREELRITQAQLADACDVTFQQIQKYERGVNRVAAARLDQIAKHLKAHPADFYGDVISDDTGPIGQLARTHDGAELATCYLAMPADHQASLVTIARALAGPSAGDLARMAA